MTSLTASSLSETELNLLRDGYREYRISNYGLRLLAESGGELVIQRVRDRGAFRITDTEDVEWLDEMSIQDVGHE